jgi:hypothetical protein
MEEEEKDYPEKIGRQVTQRTIPAWHEEPGQLQVRPVAGGKEHRIDVRPPERVAKSQIE